MTTVREQRQMLTQPHFAVLTFEFIHHEGDERSRTHPGHGYPAYSEGVTKYHAFKTQEELETWLRLNESQKNYAVLQVTPLTVERSVAVKLAGLT